MLRPVVGCVHTMSPIINNSSPYPSVNTYLPNTGDLKASCSDQHGAVNSSSCLNVGSSPAINRPYNPLVLRLMLSAFCRNPWAQIQETKAFVVSAAGICAGVLQHSGRARSCISACNAMHLALSSSHLAQNHATPASMDAPFAKMNLLVACALVNVSKLLQLHA